MGTTNTGLQVLGSALTPLHSDPAFAGAEVRKCVRPHGPLAGQVTGFQLVFANGMTFSVQWHDGAYSNVGRGYWKPGEDPDFETAAWYSEEYATVDEDGWHNTPWYNPERDCQHYHGDGSCDQVQAWQSVAEVMETARKVANHKPPHAFTVFEGLALAANATAKRLLPSDLR